jgi:hypothetical protein
MDAGNQISCSWPLGVVSAGGERNFGWSAAPKAFPVPLLPSGPGGVRGTLSHRARSSTLCQPHDGVLLRGKSLAHGRGAANRETRFASMLKIRNLARSVTEGAKKLSGAWRARPNLCREGKHFAEKTVFHCAPTNVHSSRMVFLRRPPASRRSVMPGPLRQRTASRHRRDVSPRYGAERASPKARRRNI